MSSGNVVTADEVVRWLTELKICHEEECREEEYVYALARALNFMRVTESGDAATRKKLGSAVERVRKAVKTLRKELPDLIGAQRQIFSPPGMGSDDIFDALDSAAIRVDTDFTVAENLSIFFQRLVRFENWHGDILYLRWLLTGMADRPGTQKTGFTGIETKGVKFIKTALERVGAPQIEDTIAKAFQRYDKELRS